MLQQNEVYYYKTPEFVGSGKRRKVVINGENFYLTVGENFIEATVPYENRPDNQELRQIVETLCQTATVLMGGEIE